jgi:transposase
MELQAMSRDGMSVSELARETGLDRKTVRKYLKEGPKPYGPRPVRARKIDPWRSYLRERWEAGVHNATKLFAEIQRRGYAGCLSQVGALITEWRKEERERAYVRFETEPGEQAQIDWGSFGNWQGHRLYGFTLVLGYSRMRYVEFTQRQDIEHLLRALIRAFRAMGGVPREVLADNMKTVVLERSEGRIRWNPRFLDFAAYYGFLPRVCRPYRPQTKGKIEATVRYLKQNFWPGIAFSDLQDLNRQARQWCEEVNARVHGTTGETPRSRLEREGLTPLSGQPDYDTSTAVWREVRKDCLISYRASFYSVPNALAGKRVLIRESAEMDRIRIVYQDQTLAEHRLAAEKGAMVIDPSHYAGLPLGRRQPVGAGRRAELLPGPGVGRHHVIPEVVMRPLSVYEEVAHVVAV